MENEKRLEDALFDVKAELSELKMALDEITDTYDTGLELSAREAVKFANGDTENKVGFKSYQFLLEHKKIMWLARTARMYCENAENICKSVEKE